MTWFPPMVWLRMSRTKKHSGAGLAATSAWTDACAGSAAREAGAAKLAIAAAAARARAGFMAISRFLMTFLYAELGVKATMISVGIGSPGEGSPLRTAPLGLQLRGQGRGLGRGQLGERVDHAARGEAAAVHLGVDVQVGRLADLGRAAAGEGHRVAGGHAAQAVVAHAHPVDRLAADVEVERAVVGDDVALDVLDVEAFSSRLLGGERGCAGSQTHRADQGDCKLHQGPPGSRPALLTARR